MKVSKIILLSIIGFQCLPSYSQSSFQPELTHLSIGKHKDNASDISANEYIFKDRIHSVGMDSSSNSLIIQLRGTSKNGKWLDNKGQVLLMNINDQQVKWDKSINYTGQHLIQQDSTLLELSGGLAYVLNTKNGKKGVLLKCTPYIINAPKKFVIGYTSKSSGLSNDLVCVDMTDGSLKWMKKDKNGHVWDGAFYYNDSSLLVVSAGLHSINIKDGSGWDYNATTATKDYTKAVATNVAGAALGILTGFYTVSDKADITHAFASNVLQDSSSFYFASKDKLAKIDKFNGHVIWSYDLAENETGKSTLFIFNGSLIMINYGYAFLNNRTIGIGKPFIAAFDMKTGAQKYLTPIENIKHPIISYTQQKENLLLLSKENLFKYNLHSGQLIAQNAIDKSSKQEYMYFTGAEIYTGQNQGSGMRLQLLDSNKQYVLTNTNKVLTVEDDLSLSIFSDADSLYVQRFVRNGLKFVNRKEESYILDAEDNIRASLGVSGNIGLMGNRLYSSKEEKLIETDLSEILK